jgi:hypothetical protein
MDKFSILEMAFALVVESPDYDKLLVDKKETRMLS